ncbi:abscisic aldehyde oxidase 3 [Artemisia annua]|uniref:indole-3-acetaldehyde oxidase n=1 Tax=Artemisia annua TaxID=35608 RepID=A0A2U1MWN1_ARTAN|nr:abscisic aldehyde oxidase 3 [Artemisia annua]
MDEQEDVMTKTKTCVEQSQRLVFAVNGERFELSNVDPSTTLLQFLRLQTSFKSVKLGCGEGGCGACNVLLSKYDSNLKQVEDYKINSCLTLLCSLNGCSITTTEGLGNSKDGFHSIHQRFAGFHASQCGFCTPGMCVSLFSALTNAEKTHRPEPTPGLSKLTISEAEKSISENLCRCTGYRPIADVCKSFASDVDMEDLGLNSFWKKDAKLDKLPFYDPKQICTYPDFLKNEFRSTTILNNEDKSWYSPLSVEELGVLMEAENGETVKLVACNTGIGYYKETECYDKYIDLRFIPELSVIKRTGSYIEVGASVSISKLILALREEKNEDLVLKKIASHFEKIASESVRNLASVGGNLVMAQRKSFPSDIATVLLAVKSKVTILTGVGKELLTLEEFLAKSDSDSRSVLLSVHIPYSKVLKTGFAENSNAKLLFETYRASPRPLGNALAYVNAAFSADVSMCDSGVVVNSIQLAFGSFGVKHAIRASTAEKYLVGKTLSVGSIYEALKFIKADVSPEKGTSHPAYRSSLAVSFLFEFLMPLVDAGVSNINGGIRIADECEPKTLLSSAKQVIESSKEHFPVGEPIQKTGAAIQASGEAVYVDDIPSPLNCLHGAFICSTKPLAWVKGIKLKAGNDAKNIISFKDIPKGGDNIGARTFFGTDPLFANDLTECAGQPIAFTVADTQKNADVAAETAVIDYNTENLEPPILTVEQAVERSSFYEVPSFLYPSQVGDFAKGMAEADHQIHSAEIRLPSQYYFYMETQTALAIPDEDNCMVVYSSIQTPEYAQSVIARCLNIPEHNVRVITRRVGGGFGGKAIKAMPTATACALAAHKLRRPVRTYVNRKTDMMMAGGRHPMKINYTVGFKSNGKITALHLDILVNAGMSTDISPMMPWNMIGSLKKYDFGAFSFDFKICRTNHSSKSAMRGPGEVQASFIAEAVVEHVASFLSKDVGVVRETNFHSFDSLRLFYGDNSAGEPLEYTLPSIWDKLMKSSNFDYRVDLVKKFNENNRWRKRGISRVPILHEVSLRPTPGKVSILRDASIVVEVGGIELGQGLWTKVKQMTAYCLSAVQCDGADELLEKVRVIQADTLSMVQGGWTAGSTTSEASCEAVKLCCNILVERLAPLMEKLKEQMDSVKWDFLIMQANFQSVHLSASAYFVPEFTAMRYINYGAAVSEVEINILTGETKMLQTDLIYDCGKSLNPAVDLGQIEGAFVQGIGFFMLEEYLTNSDGLVVADGTWTYKIPTIDTIPKQLNVQIINSGPHKKRVLSSKAVGEPPLLLSSSVHCATRAAIKEARKQLCSWKGVNLDGSESMFQLDVPATMPVVKTLCGLDNVEFYLQSMLSS